MDGAWFHYYVPIAEILSVDTITLLYSLYVFAEAHGGVINIGQTFVPYMMAYARRETSLTKLHAFSFICILLKSKLHHQSAPAHFNESFPLSHFIASDSG